MKINDMNGLLEEKSTSDILDMLLEELDTSATEDRDPKELTPDYDNSDIYPDDEHDQDEDVEGIVVKESYSDIELLTILEENGYEATLENLMILKEQLESGEVIIEEDADDLKEALINVGSANIGNGNTKSTSADVTMKAAEVNPNVQAQVNPNVKADVKADGAAVGVGGAAPTAGKVAPTGGKPALKESQTANGPELERASELKNEATLEKKPSNISNDYDNSDIYPDDEHDQDEDVEGVIVKESYSDYDLLYILEENGYEASLENLIILKEQLESGEAIIEDALESDPVVGEVEDKIDDTSKEAPRGKSEEIDFDSDDDSDKDEDDKDDSDKDEDEKINKLTDDDKDDSLSEGMRSIFSLIDSINESLSQTANGPELEKSSELKNEATLEKKPSNISNDYDNSDIYPDDEHDQDEDVKGIVVKEDYDLDYIDYDDYIALLEEWTPDKEISKSSSDFSGWKTFLAWFIAGIPGIIIAHLLKINRTKNDFKYEKLAQKVSEDAECKEILSKIRVAMNNKDKETLKILKKEFKAKLEVFRATLKHDEEKEKINKKRERGLITESAKNIATEKKTPKTMSQSITNSTLYPDNEHRQVEEIVDVVVEAAAICKSAGIPATRENLISEAISILEEKGFDIDEFINSKEMTGTAATEGCKKSTTKYTSIKEACMLDEDYFKVDTYSIQTSNEKQRKLTEQVSLLLARENMDPLYDELLKESIHAQRLQEAIINKYSDVAAERAQQIIER